MKEVKPSTMQAATAQQRRELAERQDKKMKDKKRRSRLDTKNTQEKKGTLYDDFPFKQNSRVPGSSA